MAEAGYTPIQLYRSATGSAVPAAGNMADGELALNTNDGKLFFKNSGGTVTEIASTGGSTGTVNGISLSGTVTTSGNLTLGGALSGVDLTSQVTGVLPTANGGTALASLGTAGQVLTVNGGASALEYTTPAAAGISAGLSIALAMVMGF